ncbi:hypothetical protein M426DRAFT_317882 [Hypoxylon sp. CI-4A]|nr:hypothetical protein M426DRAFT_317882 [Hypoxylon sp. CI-4A]
MKAQHHSPLFLALCRGKKEAVKMLLNFGANPMVEGHLFEEYQHGRQEALSYFVERGGEHRHVGNSACGLKSFHLFD